MKKANVLAIALVNAIGLATLGLGGSAGAISNCGSGHFCIWDGDNYTGGNAAALSVPVSSCRSIQTDPVFGYMDNITNSAANASGHTIYMFDSNNCSGAIGYSINDGQSIPSLGTFSNKMSSFMRADAYCNLHC